MDMDSLNVHFRYLYQSWDDKKGHKHISQTDTNQGTTRRRLPGAVPRDVMPVGRRIAKMRVRASFLLN